MLNLSSLVYVLFDLLPSLLSQSFDYDMGGPVVNVPLSFQKVRARFLAADASEER